MVSFSRLIGALLMAALVACSAGSGARGNTARERLGLGPADTEALPPWAGQPTSWEKLDAIEAWLSQPAAERNPFWRIEGRLQLAEGRLDLSDFDPTADAATLRRRKSHARSGFLLVKADGPRHQEPKAARRDRPRPHPGPRL